jgi:hypothetical protein
MGLALVALGGHPALADTAMNQAFDYQLTSCECADEPACGCEEEAAECGDGCGDDACGDVGCCESADDCCSTCCDSGCSLLGDCCLGDPWTLQDSVCGPCAPFTIAGWMQFGYHDENDGVFNTRPGEIQAQQMYLYAEKVADGSKGLGFGGRADILYGTDAPNTQSFGNPAGSFDFRNGWDRGAQYGWAMPQLYGEVAYGDLSVKVGHFYTLLGYQVVPATGNFFYSIPFTFNFSEAFTHTGALATYKASDEVTMYGGWTLGWDSGFDQINQGNSFLGGASVAASDDLTVTYICTAGNLGWIGNNGYSHAIVAVADLTDDLQYVFQTDVVDVANSVNTADGGRYETVGINQYLFYTLNDCWKAGARVEWWKADGISVNEMAYGLNYKPHANLTIRPEVRYNWSPSGDLPNVMLITGQPTEAFLDQTIFGIDAVLTF